MLLHRLPTAAGSLVCAHTPPGSAPSQLLVATADSVASYAAAKPHADATGDDASSSAAPLRRSWLQSVAHGRVELAVPLDAGGTYLLVTSHGGGSQPAQASLVKASLSMGGGPPRHRITQRLPELACGAADMQKAEPPARPAFSNLASNQGGLAVHVAASLQQGCVVLLTATREHALGAWQLAAATPVHLAELLTAEPGSTLVVRSLALAAAGAEAPTPSRVQLVVLYTAHALGGGAAATHVACLELSPLHDPAAAAAPEGAPSGPPGPRCCWFLRNVRPSTAVVAALPGGPFPRTLVADSAHLTLVGVDAAHERRQAAVQLRGQPTAAVALSEHAALVVDASGRLVLLGLERMEAVPVAVQGPLPPAPTSLAFLPLPAGPSGASALAGLLCVAGSSGAVLLGVPPEALSGSAAAEAPWQLLHGAAEPLAGPCAAPVGASSTTSIAHPSGCGDRCLLACCERSLVLAGLGACLSPLAVGGADLPALVRLLGVKATPAASRHRYLLLTSDAAAAGGSGMTSAFETSEAGLQAAEVPGLRLEAATLLAGPLPGGALLQVTPEAVRAFLPSTGAALATWQPPGGGVITLAAQQGELVAVAVGADVHVLRWSPSGGQLREERLLSLPQQAAALALFEMGGSGRAKDVWLAAGMWVTNDVLLQPLNGPAGQAPCRLSLAHRQPRSLLVCQLGASSSGSGGSGSGSGGSGVQASGSGSGSDSIDSTGIASEEEDGGLQPQPYLLCGTSSGEVLWWRLSSCSDGMQLQECGWARAGLAPVALHLLPPDPAAATAAAYSIVGGSLGAGGAQPSVLAVSDQSLLLAPDPSHPSRLAPARLHGGHALTAACPLSSADLPGSRLAYIQGGQLAIGGADGEARVRADELLLAGGARPTGAAVDASGGCAVVAGAEADGSSSLLLVDLAAMQERERARVPLLPGQSVTAVAALELPCSSRWEQQQQEQPGCRQFVAVAVTVADNGSSDGAPPLPFEQTPVPAAADAAWWWQPLQQLEEQQEAEAPDSEPPTPPVLRGRLLVYEVRSDQLVLHGACALPAAAFSLATVVPESQPFSAAPAKQAAAAAAAAAGLGSPSSSSQPSAPAAQASPLLAAGCDDGAVRLYRVFVDDASVERGHAGEQDVADLTAAVQRLGAQASQPEPGATVAAATTGAACMGGAAAEARQGLWHGRVALQLVAKAPTAWEGIPAGLHVQGPFLFARDLLSSLTVFTAQPAVAREAPSLLPLASNVSGAHFSAALPLSATAALAGEVGVGLHLLCRDPAVERVRQAAARQRWEQRRERGGAAAAAAAAGRTRHYVPVGHEAVVNLDVTATFDDGARVAAIVPGLLGVRVHGMDELHGGSSGSSSSGADGGGEQGQATVLYASGAVVSARLLTAEQHSTLIKLQAAAEATCYCDGGDGSGPAHKLVVSAPATEPEEFGIASGIDGGALAAAFLEPSWRARLANAAPSATVVHGRAILESAGLI